MRIARYAANLVIPIGLLLSSGCGGPTGSEQADQPGGATDEAKADATIGVSVLTLTNPFFCQLADAMKDEGAKHGYKVIVTSGEYNVANQKNQINDFIVKQLDAIVLCPCDSKAIGTSIRAANEAGNPVFTADIACLATGAKVVSHVATDNLGGGRKAAEAVIDMLGGSGKVAVLDFPEVESVILRTTGFKEVIGKASGIEVVGYWPGGGDRGKSFKAAEDILQSHPDLDAFFAINDTLRTGRGGGRREGRQGRSGEDSLLRRPARGPKGRARRQAPRHHRPVPREDRPEDDRRRRPIHGR